ncbi:hypothetical protein SH580_06955 [Coraliomargarita algicola]|uniref:Lipoprotein n=1 Tax=Coraliomargarita algicola TaxID=3092156 RepID=A0ABZ0RQS0_9BACT|nr:hypothetical protein [Coraliomargarita sp. J2-16]WPJ97448.1 hypothetical protein SH580_06955 [Coraliomargarita sp. J2-16]
MNHKTPIALGIVTSVTLLLSGCAVGYDSTMLVTKTNAGLEFSTTPPTAALSVNRTEGVVTPQFQDGEVLPAMASFKGSAKNLFSPAAGSTFATGDAAVAMSALFADPTPGTPTSRVEDIQRDDPDFDSSRTLTYKPIIPGLFFGLLKTEFQKNEVDNTVKVRPVFFATETSLGVKVSWSGLTATLPDSVNAGYNRKEIGILPISMTQTAASGGAQASYKMKQASLLATLDTGSKIAGVQTTDAKSVQFFAVGDSANLLSQQEYIRKAMFQSMGGAAEDALEQFEANTEKGFDNIGTAPVVHALKDIYTVLSVNLKDSKDAQAQVEALDDLANHYPRVYDFDAYELSGPTTLSKVVHKQTGKVVRNPDSFNRIINYESSLRSSIQSLKTSLAAPSTYTYSGSAVLNSKAALEAEVLKQEKLHADIIARIKSDPSINAAVRHYLSLFMK